jgi:putative ABC transport system permease protein
LLKNPNVLGVSASHAPVDFKWKTSFAIQGQTDSLQAAMLWVDEDFAKTYRLKIIKGEFLQMDYSHYWQRASKTNKNEQAETAIPAVINETAEKKLGLSDPIGQHIGDLVIVGVVKDFHFRPLQHHIEPLIMTNNPENIMTMNVKISPINQAATLRYIRDTYRKYRNSRDFLYNFFDDLLAEKYAAETRLRNLSLAFSILAILISVLGILGMSYISCQKRLKEIGIRKVNGAKFHELLIMLNTDFVKWVGAAFILACPIAWYTMNKWLQNYAYKTQLNWWLFAAAGILAIVVALITVSWHSWRAATRNPLETLRYE